MRGRKPNLAQAQANQIFYAGSQRSDRVQQILAKIRASGQTDAELKAMIDQAVAEGRVKVIPPVYTGDPA